MTPILGYPAKNRAYHLIRKRIFGGRIPLEGNQEYLEAAASWDMDQSLWSVWCDIWKEVAGQDKELKRIFNGMENGQVVWEEGYLYCKHGDRGVWLAVELDEAGQTARVDPMVSWAYPKKH